MCMLLTTYSRQFLHFSVLAVVAVVAGGQEVREWKVGKWESESPETSAIMEKDPGLCGPLHASAICALF